MKKYTLKTLYTEAEKILNENGIELNIENSLQISAMLEKDHGTLKTELGYSANYQEHKKDKDYVFTYSETPIELLTKFKTKIETFVGKVPEVIEVKPIDIIIE